MSDFNGINQFGSLTVNGQKLAFKDFDKDNNGEISEEEYNALLKEVKLDSVEFSSINTDGNSVISEDELAIYDQKTQMQDIINNMAKTISIDFAGKSSYISELTQELKNLIEEFASSYTGDIANMAKDFELQLPEKYEEIKNNILVSDSDTIKSNVLDEIYTSLIESDDATRTEGSSQNNGLPEEIAKRIAKELEAEADNFIKSYKGNNLAEDLKAHLEEYMNKSDAEKLKEAATIFKEGANSLGALIDNGADLNKLKTLAKDFLLVAIKNGVTVKLGGTNIKTEAAINTVLNKFSDGEELKAAIEDVINNLSTTTLKESLIAEEQTKINEEAEKMFTAIKGDEYQIDTTTIDYSSIDGYFDGSKLTTKGKSNHDNNIRNQARKIIEDSTLKEQMKQQIITMLTANGVSFDKIANIFENIYNSSMLQTLEGVTSHKTNKRWLNKNKKYESDQDIKTIVDNFIKNFNTNISTAIEEFNASKTDMDIIDLDYTAAGKDEDGNPIIDKTTGADISTLYATGKKLTVTGKGADYYYTLAEKMVDNMQSQMLKKAKAMCDANGVEFDNTVFNTMFNNAKLTAINTALSGSGGKSNSLWALAGGGTGVAAGGTVAVGSAIAAGGVSTSSILGVSVAASAIPIVGWIAAGVGVTSAALMAIFGRSETSSCTLDTRKLLDTFSEQFKTNYTAWVDTEKTEKKE